MVVAGAGAVVEGVACDDVVAGFATGVLPPNRPPDGAALLDEVVAGCCMPKSPPLGAADVVAGVEAAAEDDAGAPGFAPNSEEALDVAPPAGGVCDAVCC